MIFKRIIKVIVSIWIMNLSWVNTSLSHQFMVVQSILEAQKALEEANEETLILLDVDSTLTTPSDPYLRRAAIQQYRSIYDALTMPMTPNQKRIFDHVLVIQSPSQLVEQAWPQVIKDLQGRGVKLLAFTAAKMGPLDSLIPHFPVWRYQQLKHLGIDFAPIFPETILFEDLNDWGGDHPGMEKGIIYSGHKIKKGEILGHVLRSLNFQPRYIIFIDDKQDNVDSLSSATRDHFPETRFLGIHYKGLDNIPRPHIHQRLFQEKLSKIAEITKRIAS